MIRWRRSRTSRRRSTILCLLAGSAAARARDPRAAASAFAGETSNRNLRGDRVPRTSRRIWVRPSEAEAAPSRRIPAGEGTPGAGRFDRGVTSRATRAPPRAPVDTTRRYTAKEARSPPRGWWAAPARPPARRCLRSRLAGSDPARRRLDQISTPSPAGRNRHPTAPSAAPSAAPPAARARARVRARPGSCPRALRRRRMRLVAPSRRARRWWQSWSGNARRARWRPRRRGVRGVRRRRSTRRRASSRSGWTASGDRSGRSDASPRSWDERRGGCRTVVTKKSVRASLTELERRGPLFGTRDGTSLAFRRPGNRARDKESRSRGKGSHSDRSVSHARPSQ